MEYGANSARRGSLPPSGATSGYSAAPVLANFSVCRLTKSANAIATSWTNDGNLLVFQLRVRTGNGCSHNLVIAWMLARTHYGMEPHLLVAGETFAKY